MKAYFISRAQYQEQRANSKGGARDCSGLSCPQTQTMMLSAILALGVPALAQVPHDRDRDNTKSSIQGVVSVEGPDGQPGVDVGATLELAASPRTEVAHSGLSDSTGHYHFDGQLITPVADASGRVPDERCRWGSRLIGGSPDTAPIVVAFLVQCRKDCYGVWTFVIDAGSTGKIVLGTNYSRTRHLARMNPR
jgi:hypothetical protein